MLQAQCFDDGASAHIGEFSIRSKLNKSRVQYSLRFATENENVSDLGHFPRLMTSDC